MNCFPTASGQPRCGNALGAISLNASSNNISDAGSDEVEEGASSNNISDAGSDEVEEGALRAKNKNAETSHGDDSIGDYKGTGKLRRLNRARELSKGRWPMPLTLVQARSLKLEVGYSCASDLEMTSRVMSFHEANKKRYVTPDSRTDHVSLECPFPCTFQLKYGFRSRSCEYLLPPPTSFLKSF